MKFTSLRTSDFRNLEIENVKTDSKSVILTGPDGWTMHHMEYLQLQVH